jgi:hypothetical protein
MNLPQGHRQQQQEQQQKQKALIIKKQENTLEFHSRLIEAAEVRFFPSDITGKARNNVPQRLKSVVERSAVSSPGSPARTVSLKISGL